MLSSTFAGPVVCLCSRLRATSMPVAAPTTQRPIEKALAVHGRRDVRPLLVATNCRASSISAWATRVALGGASGGRPGASSGAQEHLVASPGAQEPQVPGGYDSPRCGTR